MSVGRFVSSAVVSSAVVFPEKRLVESDYRSRKYYVPVRYSFGLNEVLPSALEMQIRSPSVQFMWWWWCRQARAKGRCRKSPPPCPKIRSREGRSPLNVPCAEKQSMPGVGLRLRKHPGFGLCVLVWFEKSLKRGKTNLPIL